MPYARSLNEAEHAIGAAVHPAQAKQVRVRGLEVPLPAEEGETEDSCIEIEATLPVRGDASHVMYAVQAHRSFTIQ
jgi:hypothetical protein